jgi:error-prone DNA polymerase
MGFYAPAQLVNDARRSGVVFPPIDVQHSEWDRTLEENNDKSPEILLGLRIVAEHRIASGPRKDIGEFADRAHLPKRSMELLARVGALISVVGHRRPAHWGALGIATALWIFCAMRAGNIFSYSMHFGGMLYETTCGQQFPATRNKAAGRPL